MDDLPLEDVGDDPHADQAIHPVWSEIAGLQFGASQAFDNLRQTLLKHRDLVVIIHFRGAVRCDFFVPDSIF